MERMSRSKSAMCSRQSTEIDVLEVSTDDSIFYQFILPLLRSGQESFNQERLFGFAIQLKTFFIRLFATL
jgi:hypothetical protein